MLDKIIDSPHKAITNRDALISSDANSVGNAPRLQARLQEFYSNLSSDSDSDIDQNLDKLKNLFSSQKTLNQYLTATSPR